MMLHKTPVRWDADRMGNGLDKRPGETDSETVASARAPSASVKWIEAMNLSKPALLVTGLVCLLTYLLGLLPFALVLVLGLMIGAGAIVQSHAHEEKSRRALLRVTSQGRQTDDVAGIGTKILSQLPDAIILIDEKNRITIYNEAAVPFIGGAASGKLIASAFREPAVMNALDQFRAGAGPQTFEIEKLVPVERHFRVTLTPAETNETTVHENGAGAALLILHDISEMKRIEQMRVDFVANASHELKTPLASVSGFIETLQGPARDDEEARERFLAIMAEQTMRMKRLIADLLSLSRIELREHRPPTGTVQIKQLIKDVVDAVTPIAERDGVDLHIELADDLPPLRGDWDELYQVIQNLVDNAVKYGRSGKRVEISAVRSEGRRSGLAVITVRDFGPGIARQHIPRLTERFYRIDVATSRERGGTGLGLAIVKHIVNRHGGEMLVESQLGEGTSFTVFLPLEK